MATISVIIPCLNEEKYLGKLLDDLAAQIKQPDEVIVSDCQSDDKTVAIAKSYKNKLPLKIVVSKTRTPGAARNAGARDAGGEYLLFIDADMRIPKDSVERIQKSLEAHPVDFLTPAFRSDGRHLADKYLMWIVKNWMKANYRRSKLTGIGGMMCVKRSVHKKASGFNEQKTAQNDIDYLYRLRRAKASSGFLKDLTVTSSSRRFEGHGLLVGLGIVLLENSGLARGLFQPILRPFGKEKKYGHYR